MKFFEKCKDGGKDSPVDAYFFFEIKGFMSIAFLKFNKGTRENFHSHAFHALTWFLLGDMEEIRIYNKDAKSYKKYKFNLIPKFTGRENVHKVVANEVSYAFTIRFNWAKYWVEYNEEADKTTILTNGRKIVDVLDGLHITN